MTARKGWMAVPDELPKDADAQRRLILELQTDMVRYLSEKAGFGLRDALQLGLPILAAAFTSYMMLKVSIATLEAKFDSHVQNTEIHNSSEQKRSLINDVTEPKFKALQDQINQLRDDVRSQSGVTQETNAIVKQMARERR